VFASNKTLWSVAGRANPLIRCFLPCKLRLRNTQWVVPEQRSQSVAPTVVELGAATRKEANMKPAISLAALLSPLLAVGMVYAQQEKPPTPPFEPSTPEAIKQFNDDKVAELSKQIAGKENQPAEAVFKNIKILSGVPAGKLLQIMQMGYSRSLGTSCVHCHVPGQWEKDDKPPKQIARDMSKMSHTIIFDLLRNIDGIKDRDPLVNCTTCHRGQLKPALNLDSDGTKK